MSAVTRFEDLRVYQRAYEAAMEIYQVSRDWPKEERYALTDQIRRSSRSVCANIAEAWRKRPYPKHFASKLSDADAEAAETRVWLSFAKDCGFMQEVDYQRLTRTYDAISGSLVKMMKQSDQWTSHLVREEPASYDGDSSA